MYRKHQQPQQQLQDSETTLTFGALLLLEKAAAGEETAPLNETDFSGGPVPCMVASLFPPLLQVLLVLLVRVLPALACADRERQLLRFSFVRC